MLASRALGHKNLRRWPNLPVSKILKLAVVPLLLAASPLTGAGPAEASPATHCPVWDGAAQPATNAITVLSPCTAWAVGTGPSTVSINRTATVIEQLTGSSWEQQASPSPGGQNTLSAIAATSASNAWAVGNLQGAHAFRALIEHWNGASWHTQLPAQPGGSTHPDVLLAVGASSAGDAWAVGDYGTGHGRLTLIEHWNGTAWTQAPSPSPGGPSHVSVLTSIAVVSATKAWAVGYYQTPKTGRQTLIAAWNGKAWQRMPSSNPGPSHQAQLSSVTATTASNAWAVGFTDENGGSLSVMLHWDGHSWTQVPTPDLTPFGFNDFFGVAATSTSNVWVVGAAEVPQQQQSSSLMLHWNGETWVQYQVPGFDLTGVATSPQGNAWAVGAADEHGLTLHWDGHSWQD